MSFFGVSFLPVSSTSQAPAVAGCGDVSLTGYAGKGISMTGFVWAFCLLLSLCAGAGLLFCFVGVLVCLAEGDYEEAWHAFGCGLICLMVAIPSIAFCVVVDDCPTWID